MAWQTFPHEADIGVRGTGTTIDEAFTGAALALTAVICDPAMVAPQQSLEINCAAPDVELLLIDWLNALIYEMATRKLLLSRFDVEITSGITLKNEEPVETHALHATVWGEPVDVPRHRPAAEIKGATFCELDVGQDACGHWHAQCVVDV
jgi:SHS2 domain-containing protein